MTASTWRIADRVHWIRDVGGDMAVVSSTAVGGFERTSDYRKRRPRHGKPAFTGGCLAGECYAPVCNARWAGAILAGSFAFRASRCRACAQQENFVRFREAHMYAVIKTGGKQYKVAAGEKIKVEQIAADVGQEIVIDQVLAVGVAART